MVITKRENINTILASEKFAVAGVSRNKNKFGNVIFKELLDRGFISFPINPNSDTVINKTCYPDLKSLPEKVDALIINTKPDKTEKLVEEAFDTDITKIWIQQGAESPEVINFCESKNMIYVSGECLLMYLEPVGLLHKFHRGIWKLLGKYHK